jgi:hypothetical protein
MKKLLSTVILFFSFNSMAQMNPEFDKITCIRPNGKIFTFNPAVESTKQNGVKVHTTFLTEEGGTDSFLFSLTIQKVKNVTVRNFIPYGAGTDLIKFYSIATVESETKYTGLFLNSRGTSKNSYEEGSCTVEEF